MNKSVDLILEFGEALHSYGAASYNLEQALLNISRQLGLEGEFFATPTLLISSFKGEPESRTYVKRVYPSDIDLRKLSYLDKLGDKLINSEIDISAAYTELKRIRNLDDPFKGILRIFAYALIACCASVFFDANFGEMLSSAAIGLIIGLIGFLSQNNSRRENFKEFLAAFIASFLAVLLQTRFANLDPDLIIVASLIPLIPGLSLTISITELATMNLASGTARLMQALLTFFKLAFGLALGLQLSQFLNLYSNPNLVSHELDLSHKITALVFAALASSFLFKIPLRYYPWVLCSASLGFFTTYFFKASLGVNMATFIAAFLVCLFANAFARWYKRPALLLELPGLILMVPGSLGFKGLRFFFEHNTLSALETVFDTFLLALALVSGFLLANILLVPKRSL